jgi:hypothetical protein
LVPRLKDASVSVCTDRESFDIGVPALINMENAVAHSRHTLLVLTPAYLESQWTRYESLLVQFDDPSGLLQHTLPVMRQSCQLPRRIAMLTYADLTGRADDTAEFNKLLRAIRGQRSLPGADGGPTPQREAGAAKRDNGAGSFQERLRNLGFERDPFAFPEAEKMPPDSLEETFVAHPGFFEHVMDLERSTALLASPGSGKTAGRLRMEMDLKQMRQQHASGLSAAGSGPEDVPLVVSYNYFAPLVRRLPNITIEDHTAPLIGAFAESAYSLIEATPKEFLTRAERLRDWWWAFLREYLKGEDLEFRLDDPELDRDWRRKSSRLAPFNANTELQDMLDVIERRLPDLGARRLCILVDEVDGHGPADVAPIVVTILNTLPLLSSANVLWKLFLPSNLEATVRSTSGYQTGRLNVVSIDWDAASLQTFLRLRLEWASNGGIGDIERICHQKLLESVHVEDELIALALRHARFGPPRALLSLCEELLRTMRGELLALDDWRAFITNIQKNLMPQASGDLKESLDSAK